jgi:phage terminase large subunit
LVAINDIYLNLLENKSRYLAIKGGAGSGKSIFMAQKMLIRTTCEENHRFLVLRKIGRTCRGSVFQIFKDLIAEYGLGWRFKVNKSEMRFTDTINGNEIICAGLDDPEKIKSVQGITGMWLEEATEFSAEDFDQLDLRIRGKHLKNYVQFLISFNPIDSNHWLKKRFFDTPASDVVAVTTTYKDNLFLDDAYIRVLEERMAKNPYMYAVYVLGNWGQVNRGGEFYKTFNWGAQVRTKQYDPDATLHITFDFNVNPYVTLNVWQVYKEGAVTEAYQIDEITLPSPRNRTREAAREFARRYKGHLAGVRVYGDPAGRAEDTRSEKGHNDFTVIMSELKDFRNVIKCVKKSAPKVGERGEFVNAVFNNEIPSLAFYISKTCTETLNDYMYIKETTGTKGRIVKLKEKVKINGVMCEKYGHTSDANDYFLTTLFETEFKSYIKGGRREFIYKTGTNTKTKQW